MFSNIGNKVCTIAKVIGWFGVIAIIGGLVMILLGIDEDEFLIAGCIIAPTGLMLLISSWPIYAFGQITNDVRAIKDKLNGEN